MLYQIIAKKNEGDKVGNTVREPLGTVTPPVNWVLKIPHLSMSIIAGLPCFLRLLKELLARESYSTTIEWWKANFEESIRVYIFD